MSGHGFHVHGPHDHEVEHVAQHGGDNFTSRVAVPTAVISTVGAIFGYMGGHSQNAALLYKAKAADHKSDLEMHVHERWALATTLMQVAIALSAITLLPRKRWMLAGVYGATAAGAAFGALGYLHL
nr:DUF4337 family protein [uncultured Noviherbaspirillum sp.]